MTCWKINVLSIIDTDCKIHGVDCIIRLCTHHVDLSKLRSMQTSGSCPDISRSIIHIQHRIEKNHNTLTVYTVGTSTPQQKVLTQIPQPKLLTNIPQNNRPQHDCKIIVHSTFCVSCMPQPISDKMSSTSLQNHTGELEQLSY